MELYFPHKEMRPIQKELVAFFQEAIENKQHALVHAPTGLGKTASALAPALSYALANQKTVFFLTSRHTQHTIALKTAKKMKEKWNLSFITTDIIGKKALCLMPHVEKLPTNEFFEYCKHQREDKTCEFYVNTRTNPIRLTTEAKATIEEIKKQNPLTTQELIAIAQEKKLCPYELSLALAKDSQLIIGDYYYIFHPAIATSFLKKIEKEWDDLIVIVDEGHNLPHRLRDLGTLRLTSLMIKRAMKEAKQYKFPTVIEHLAAIQHALVELAYVMETKKQEEMLITKNDFLKFFENYEGIITDLEQAAETIRSIKNHSSLSTIPVFLTEWINEKEGHSRMISKESWRNEENLILSYRCLDPSIISSEFIAKTHSTLVMSGTLMPPEMYADLLGFDQERTKTKIFTSPFPPKNKLNLIVPKTTTQYKKRTQEQFLQIAQAIASLTEAIPGNVAVFFPSYYLRDQVYEHLKKHTKKPLLLEHPNLSKQEKEVLLEEFKGYAKPKANLGDFEQQGAILLACQSGSFGEGIDLPGDYLKGVIVVGLPLAKPDLETSEIIAYYDKKFGKGWEYGYIYPAFSKILQSAGRCIRSETDKGVIIFLDERFAWQNYRKNFPPEEHYHISFKPEEEIQTFFSNHATKEQQEKQKEGKEKH